MSIFLATKQGKKTLCSELARILKRGLLNSNFFFWEKTNELGKQIGAVQLLRDYGGINGFGAILVMGDY